MMRGLCMWGRGGAGKGGGVRIAEERGGEARGGEERRGEAQGLGEGTIRGERAPWGAGGLYNVEVSVYQLRAARKHALPACTSGAASVEYSDV